jgi:solute carrier family 25 folate transporter 32
VAVSLSPLDYFIASGAAGLLIAVATNPIWVLKTRMLSSDKGADGAYPSMWAGARVVWAREGWRGFYKGLGVSCLGVSHGAVQFAVYEPLKRSWLRYVARKRGGHRDGDRAESKEEQEEEKFGNEATLFISGAAKLVAGTATYPYQVVRSRLQTYDAEEKFGKGIRGVVGRVWREEGWRGFYKGLGPNVFRVMPATWVTFLVYENVRYYLPRWAV